MVPRWLSDLGKVLLTAAGAVAGLLTFAFLPLAVLSLAGSEVAETVCFGVFLCWPTLTVLGTLSIALGFALAARLYGEGHPALPDAW